MKIGELARRTGLTASRIRFYESRGLLPMVDRMPNGYRRYPNEAQLVLELIDTAQKAGFSLDEIRTLLPASLEKWDHTALVTTLRGKLAEIVALEKRLAESKAQLQTLLRDIESKPEDMTCADNAQRVLSRMLLGQRDASEAPDLPQISGRTG
jgi:DNA-binding transcriptional MerR regulator